MQLALPLNDRPALSDIRDRLRAVHGPQRDEQRHDPTSQFVRAMLSSCTQDDVSTEAFKKLCLALPSWDALPGCDPAAVAAIICGVTHAEKKAVQLVSATRIIRAERGSLDLTFLADMPTGAAFSWLRRLPGVGSKIAAVTLNFSTLRKPLLAVDRHVLRVSKRLGLLPPNADFDRGFHLLMQLVPPDWSADELYELHWLLKMHGQTVCRARWVACERCPLVQLCANSTVTTTIPRTGHHVQL
jgi:endonuclease III